MGLDQYARATRNHPNAPVDFEVGDDDEEFHYWRKHPDLHGWMEGLYREKGGTREFNCAPVILDAGDFDKLERAIRDRMLPPTTGFFFGHTSLDDEEIADDLLFIAKARKMIADGQTVYYTSWW
jgi:hypothetical protein